MNAAKFGRDRIGNENGSPRFGVARWRGESRRHHADDGVHVSAERDRFANDTRISVEVPLPQTVTQYDYMWRADFVVGSSNRSAQLRRDAERLKIAAGDVAIFYLHR